jgi:hypothetical protein
MQPAASNALRPDKSQCTSMVFIFEYCIVLDKFTPFHHKQDLPIFNNFNPSIFCFTVSAPFQHSKRAFPSIHCSYNAANKNARFHDALYQYITYSKCIMLYCQFRLKFHKPPMAVRKCISNMIVQTLYLTHLAWLRTQIFAFHVASHNTVSSIFVGKKVGRCKFH